MSVRPDGIHQRGRSAVLAGQERLDVPPGPGSTRWGLSLDVRLDPAAEQHLDALATEASAHAGPGQWLTGARGSSHLTVTYLERTWREVGADDEDVRRYAALMAALAAGTPPLRPGAFRVEGVPPAAGRYRWVLTVDAPGLSDRHDLGVVTVFAEHAHSLTKLGQALLAPSAHTVAVDPRTHLVYFPLERGASGGPELLIMKPS